jgi:hypothetical protein
MKYKFFYNIALITMSCFLFAGCIKEEVVDLGDAGKTRVKIAEAPENLFFLDQFAGVKPISLFSIRRDANASAELNKPATVTIHMDPADIAVYNAAHGTTYELLPDSLYTLGAGITSTGSGNYTFNFEPGEFSKDFLINLNGSKWDLAHKYAFPVSITDPGGYEIGADQDQVISLISVKNQYDGKYSVLSGTVTRYTAPGVPANDALSGSVAGNPDVTLTTINANTVEIGNLQWANAGGGVGGINNLRLSVDPATNLVTMFALGAPTLTNWAGHENRYDPATRTFYLAFRWNPTSTTREYEMVIKYKGPR